MLSQLQRAVRSARRARSGQSLTPAVERFEDRLLLSATPSPTALTPAEVRAYYGFSNITYQSVTTITFMGHKIFVPIAIPGDGRGQTIAIIDKYYDPDIVNDVGVFDSQFNLPAIHLTVDKLPTATTTDPNGSWENEESLDVEWAHAIAPGANIVVVNCGPTFADVLKAVNAAKNYAGVSVVSMSLGGDEFTGELADDSYFTNPSNHGGVNVSFVASSGDDNPADVAGPLYPSSSPNVLAVGGTVLKVSSSGNSEVSWQDSEGGQSVDELEPRYQEFVQQTGFRTTPDVSYAATNFAAYDSFPILDTTTNTLTTLDWHTPEGTSLGAPQWAALIAIANQGRALEGKPTLSDVPQVFYTLPSTDFNDIVSGPADREGNAPGPGYDEITGLGSPKANLIVQALLNPPFFLFPPFLTSLAVSNGNVTAPNSTPQAGPDALVLESFSTSTHDAALDQPTGSAALSLSPLTAFSNEPMAENSAAPLGVSGAPATSASAEPITLENVSVSHHSSRRLFGRGAGSALSDAGAVPVSFRFIDQENGFALTGSNHAGDSNQVPANAAVHDDGRPQLEGAEDGAPPAGAALLSRATDAIFERRAWIVDGANPLLQSPGAVVRQKGAAPMFAVAAGVLSAWVVRRRLRSAKRTSPDEMKS